MTIHFEQIEALASGLIRKQLVVSTAESCTGGWIAKSFTDLPGSSNWFDSGFVCYSNASKVSMLDVKLKTLEECGAVSQQCVEELVLGALTKTVADIAVAVTGVAGPGGGTKKSPVGSVWFAWAAKECVYWTGIQCFEGDREAIRQQVVNHAVQGLIKLSSEW